jgi:diguanylate cyclase (GGDEF)-like protein
MSGIEICRSIRKAEPEQHTYVVLLARKPDAAGAVAGLDCGADDLVSKPMNLAELIARLKVGIRVLKSQEDLTAASNELNRAAAHDDLTGLFGRDIVLNHLERETAKAGRQSGKLGVMLLDLDNLRRVNDNNGRTAGDEVLKEIGSLLHSSFRPYDMVGRFDGEEFLVVLPDCGPKDLATRAEEIRAAIAKLTIEHGDGVVLPTVTIGIASLETKPVETSESLLRRAEAALYQAKRSGINRVAGSAEIVGAEAARKTPQPETFTIPSPVLREAEQQA